MIQAAVPLRTRSIATATAGNAGVLAVQAVARIGTVAIFAAALGPYGQGLFTRATLLATVAAGVLGFGLEIALTRSAAIPDLRRDGLSALWTQMLLASGTVV